MFYLYSPIFFCVLKHDYLKDILQSETQNMKILKNCFSQSPSIRMTKTTEDIQNSL